MTSKDKIQTKQVSNSQEHQVDTDKLKLEINNMYTNVALNPHDEFHFKMGRDLAESLGYSLSEMDQIPEKSIESFAGVGYFFDLAQLREGENILDLGSGSGFDTFYAALKVGPTGTVKGIDMNQDQIDKAEMLRKSGSFNNIEYVKADMSVLDFEDDSFDVIMSNGVFNLIPDKKKLFKEIHRILKPGGRLVFADIISESALPENIKCNSTLWASCIGGAEQKDNYIEMIENAGIWIEETKHQKQYSFISDQALNASEKWGVKSYCFLGVKQ